MDNSLTVTDPRTNTVVKIAIDPRFGTIPGTAFAQFKLKPTIPPSDDPNDRVPLRLYDPGFKNTTVCRSKISNVDGENGKLYYRGYDVEELCEKSNFLEVAYLLNYGELPDPMEAEKWSKAVMTHTYIHAELEKQMMSFRYDAHPHGMLIATIASLSTFHPEANPALQGTDFYMSPKIPAGQEPTPEQAEKVKHAQEVRNKATFRMLGKTATIAANVYRHRLGRPYNHPMPGVSSYTENLLYMMDKLNEPDYRPDRRLVRALDTMFILLAEHGSNCSTILMRHLMSSGVDPYTALSGSAGALFGERKASAVITMLKEIGKVEKIQHYLSIVKRRESFVGNIGMQKINRPARLMGFGHRVYKTGDPRVKIAKKVAFDLFALMGKDNVAELALALEEAVAADEWFTKRGLYPNIDFWSAIVFHTLGFPVDMFPVLLTVPRVAGLIANCWESLDDPEYKIYRPRQIYTGEVIRKYSRAQERRLSLDNSALAYLQNDPLAAKRRGTADPNSSHEIDDIVSRTQRSIDELNDKLLELETLGVDPQLASAGGPRQQGGATALATNLSTRVSSWVSGRLFNSPTGVGHTLQLAEQLRKTQAELTTLLEKQREMLVANAEANSDSNPARNEEPQASSLASSTLSPTAADWRASSGRSPNLLGGGSPRAIAPTLSTSGSRPSTPGGH
ncbi:citrate synthase-like protein [Fimicolochytrium jonesii]|uniref:citrate synthase-like protein n=1 Tax=Fimicolochytrium jonesii TaxID=1396493 RepID=UPI0022FDEAB9|nr:citrate synthase-like protein [Fimicolochytrium jonesii]KAI8819592.1 citrate synthase-like protein [Fimicolochytrium jonesii]